MCGKNYIISNVVTLKNIFEIISMSVVIFHLLSMLTYYIEKS